MLASFKYLSVKKYRFIGLTLQNEKIFILIKFGCRKSQESIAFTLRTRNWRHKEAYMNLVPESEKPCTEKRHVAILMPGGMEAVESTIALRCWWGETSWTFSELLMLGNKTDSIAEVPQLQSNYTPSANSFPEVFLDCSVVVHYTLMWFRKYIVQLLEKYTHTVR